MVSSSARKWLGSVTLAGLLLASSLPVLASTGPKTTTSSAPIKPMLVASTIVPTGTYTQAVRKQMQWISIPKKSVPKLSEPVAVVDNAAQSTKAAQSAEKARPAKKVQVAEVPKQQVSRSSSSTLVDNALSLKGVPYVFGGTSKSGFDCSGYTQYVFKGSGISLPRSSSEQFNMGSSVKKEQLQAGDLVFFTTYTEGPSHVGIYLGGGNFVHASNSGVRTTSLSDSYYASRYVGARRVN